MNYDNTNPKRLHRTASVHESLRARPHARFPNAARPYALRPDISQTCSAGATELSWRIPHCGRNLL